MGIGGSGVSALARVYRARGDEVTGCDVKESDGTWALEDAGVRGSIGHGPEHVLKWDRLVFGRATTQADVDDVASVFQEFRVRLDGSGVAVVCADDARAAALRTNARRVTYGFAPEADYRCGRERPFPIHHDGRELGRINLQPPGWHNVENATGAAAMALELGVSFPVVASALGSFTGARRRMERLGVFHGALVYDDYAHHPAKVRAALQAPPRLRHRRLIVVFPPHRYTRLAALLPEFARAFEDADRVLIVDVYAAGEDNPTGISARDLADQMPRGLYVGDFESARTALEELVGRDDLVLLMGAGDIREKLGDELAQKI